jgi:hypothetical protein
MGLGPGLSHVYHPTAYSRGINMDYCIVTTTNNKSPFLDINTGSGSGVQLIKATYKGNAEVSIRTIPAILSTKRDCCLEKSFYSLFCFSLSLLEKL